MAATLFVESGVEAATKPWGYRDASDWEGANRAAELQMAYYESLERDGLLRIVRSRGDLADDALPRLVILMEGADPIRDGDDVARWHARGVRMVGLTWALGSRFAGGNQTGGGITAAGRDVIAALDAHHIVHDASHLSDAALDDLVTMTDQPIVASHSNARALLNSSERHIRDEHIREITRRGGVVGLNLYGKFLAVDRPATLEDAIHHIEHIAQVAGCDSVNALGSDLDGGFSPALVPAELRGPQRYHALTDALLARGWTGESCARFASENWLSVWNASLAQTSR